jgi:phage-related minor tail protein
MNEENFQFLLNLLGKATDQLERVIGIVEKQNHRIDSLETKVAKLEKQEGDK